MDPKPTAEDANAALANVKRKRTLAAAIRAEQEYNSLVRALSNAELRKHAKAQGIPNVNAKNSARLRELLGVEG